MVIVTAGHVPGFISPISLNRNISWTLFPVTCFIFTSWVVDDSPSDDRTLISISLSLATVLPLLDNVPAILHRAFFNEPITSYKYRANRDRKECQTFETSFGDTKNIHADVMRYSVRSTQYRWIREPYMFEKIKWKFTPLKIFKPLQYSQTQLVIRNSHCGYPHLMYLVLVSRISKTISTWK